MLCAVCPLLMSNILIHLKGCAKTVPLHSTLPANPRHWLGADSKATPVGLCTTRSQVNTTARKLNNAGNASHSHSYVLMEVWFTFSITAAQFFFILYDLFACFFWVIRIIFGRLHSVFLFHMDARDGGGLRGGCLPACCHKLHLRFLKVAFLKATWG